MIRIIRTTRALALISLVALLATAFAQGMNHGRATAPGAAFSPMGMGVGFNMPMGAQTVDEASFLVHMIPHHREAVASAQALGTVTERPELLALVDAIVTSQTAEIEAMEGWLDAWYPNVVRDVAYAPMMRDLGPDAVVADVERAFLEDMVGHHMMAVHEAQTLLVGGFAEHAEVADLARSIVNAQMGEMQQMMAWLGTWYGVAAPMPMGPGMMGMPGIGTGALGETGFMNGYGMGGHGMGGHGMGGYGLGGYGMGSYGMGSYGMGSYGMGSYGVDGSMAGFHQAMHGGSSSATIGAAEAERLALAFLAGRGEAADATQVTGSTFAFEVVVRIGDAEQVLRVDGRTGQVTLVSER
ncbi:MAG: DUF305 domain-containing protein [Trueperaceae bacterium]|nr:DUF305 domain-containing protein [Trueperaceae bacterium]